MGNILSKIAKKIELLPEVDFSISTTGITIYSKRFKEPRYLEFEKKENVEIAKRECPISVTILMPQVLE
jgi:hypothetical protein